MDSFISVPGWLKRSLTALEGRKADQTRDWTILGPRHAQHPPEERKCRKKKKKCYVAQGIRGIYGHATWTKGPLAAPKLPLKGAMELLLSLRLYILIVYKPSSFSLY